MGGSVDDETRRKLAAQNQNVIIPDVGAAKYWYVDPRAKDASMPVSHTDLEQQALYRADPNRYSPAHEAQTQGMTDVMRRIFQAQSDAQRQRDRESVYGTIGVKIDGEEQEVPLWHKGMTPEQAEDAARMRFEWDLSAFAPEEELQAAQDRGAELSAIGDLFKRLQLQPKRAQAGF
jgi:hypothetical protein